ncbi:spore photoproduct lyase [Desulfatibacillum alkenivorans DSM 16219]|jgi:spore photoproduct lyase|uniref:Spore photoproduct lyase n=1 Tax=Desulfatibacillum alkenivorans DSM 16219 TaxID=1121393 RepID=A0A1M6HVJ9_9BACT|nr:DNA photolyase [Desulfatibacillum alkenivorans]SHJ26260.1 spore photoproduct lyase [Desulfatibacillum alkenivorans DSM 16219]
MTLTAKNICTVYIDQDVQDLPNIQPILDYFQDVPREVVDGPTAVFRRVAEAADPISAAKEILYLTKNKGAFVRKCPGTKEYTCCGYQILHIGTFCTMDCSYCVLQAYFHPPALQFFVNHEDLFAELDQVLESRNPEIRRIGTGEFTDSMIWEPWSGLSHRLVERFGRQDHAVLELKSKTVNIQGLDKLSHNRKTIMAWSVNTPEIIATQERNTAPLHARLAAAAKCESWGYPLAFHFDPMVIYPGCEEEYKKVVNLIFDHVSPENVAWISLGTFRFMPDLKAIIESRFEKSKIVYGEFITGLDNKMRYFKPLRIKLFQVMAAALKKRAPQVTAYFCMEDDEVWRKSFNRTPDLPPLLDQSAQRVCGIKSGS